MRVEASGICGSDLMEWYRVQNAPLVLGHEVAGVVEEVGSGSNRFAPGDRIVTTHHVPCGQCRYCLNDRHSVCETLRTTNFDPGGFAEFVRIPALNVQAGTFLLPGGVSFEEASFVEPLACVVRGQRIAGVQRGDAVAVLGSGISGILHIQMARVLGAGPIIATDVHPYRLNTARRLGADLAADARDDVPRVIRQTNAGRLADRVLVTTAAKSALGQAFGCVDRGGVILFFAPSTPEVHVDLPLWEVWRNGITLTTSYAGPPADMQAALDLIESGRVDVASMVTHRLGLDEIGEGFRMMEEGGESLKVIIEPQR
jgi:L-iditol 2-dehydrogenase